MIFMNQLCVPNLGILMHLKYPNLDTICEKNPGEKNLRNAKENRMIKRVHCMLQI